jgi:uncharacterized protein with HEPN domain
VSKKLDAGLVDVLLNILIWCDKIRVLMSEFDYPRFESDEMAQLGLSKAVEQVGEMSNRVLKRWPDFVKSNEKIRFANAYAMRNRLTHFYVSVDLPILWQTLQTSIPEMREQLASILNAHGEDAI